MRPRNYCFRRGIATGVAGAWLVLCLSGAAHGVTVYMQDLGNDFVPAAGNALGDLVGYKLSTGQAAWRHPDGQIDDFGALGGAQSRATAINDDGTVVVGWAHNATGVQNSFRTTGGSLSAIFSINTMDNRAVGLDSTGNVVINLQSGPFERIYRWNQSEGTSTLLVSDAEANGVNGNGKIVGTRGGEAIYYDGATHFISPDNYAPVGGISDTELTAGAIGSLAAYHQLGDALAQTIPGINALGANSSGTGVNDHNLIVGKTDATVFLYEVNEGNLIDLNAGELQGAGAFYLLALYGITDADVFFGQYINFLGQLRYFRGALDPAALALPGDFDGDGDVDGRDFLVWQRNPNVGNLSDWRGNYGIGGLSALSQASRAVPEPSWHFLGFLVVFVPLSRKRL